ncbi:MAG: carboxypeptidase regulatory-like domain-containing protein [Acidimicrobiales bacterium]
MGSINATRSTRRRALLAAVAMLATTIAVLASSPAPAWAANGTLSGVLTSSVGATPVGGVTVEAYGGYYGNLWGTATSDADGSFELSLPSGDFRIRYVDPTGAHTTVYWGGATTYVTATTVHVPGGGAATADWTLPAAASIGGTVTSSVGPPLAGVTVEVLDAASATVLTTAVTAADGTWARAVAPGNRKLRATAVDAHITQTFSGNATDLSSAATIVVGPLADVEHDLIMATPAALVGTVRKAGGVPVAGVTVEALDPVWGGVIDTTATGADGTYLLALPAGTYRVRFHDPGGVLADRYSGGSLDWASSSTVAVPPGAATTVNATLANNPRVRGRVRTPAQVYLGGITVQAVGLNGVPAASTTTAADGTYDLSVLPGSYRVRFLDPGGTYAMTYEGGAAARAVPGAHVGRRPDRAGQPQAVVSGEPDGPGEDRRLRAGHHRRLRRCVHTDDPRARRHRPDRSQRDVDDRRPPDGDLQGGVRRPPLAGHRRLQLHGVPPRVLPGARHR